MKINAVPIVVFLAGALIIVTAIYYESTGIAPGEGERLSENDMWVLIGIGVVFVLVGIISYFWERNRYRNEVKENKTESEPEFKLPPYLPT